jgi:uncharacterized membrane protein (DUF4010 family)
MEFEPRLLAGFAAALGGGLLIGVERERRKGFGAHRALAGVRTFTMAALGGATAAALDQPLLLFAGALLIAALAAISHWRTRSSDPGITTEMALFVTYALGALAIGRPVLAAGGAVIVAVILAARQSLHEFSIETLSETELRDCLLFAALALILLPLLPNTPLSWLAGGNPRRIFTLVITFMALQAAGYIALRAAGARLGLALSGLAAGFVTSTGTIAALGARARKQPQFLAACVAGALFSNVATIVLLAIITVTVYLPALAPLAPALGGALAVAVAAAAFGLWRQRESAAPDPAKGRAFNLGYALVFAAILSGATAVMGLLNSHYGQVAAGMTAAITGFFDVHAAATSSLSLAAAGGIPPQDVLLLMLMALSTNTISKLIAAFASGGAAYGLRVAGGLLGITAAAWAPLLWSLR